MERYKILVFTRQDVFLISFKHDLLNEIEFFFFLLRSNLIPVDVENG